MAEEQIVKVSSQPRHTLYINRAKEVLAKFDTVELHGLGDSTINVVRAADSLCNLGYCELVRFNTDMVTERSRTVKAVIVLKKTKDFDRLKKEFDEARSDQPVDLLNKA